MKNEDFNGTKDGLMTLVINKVSAMALRMTEDEVKKLSKLIVNQPNLTKASMSLASSMNCRMNWDVIMTSLMILTMDSVNYSKIAKAIKEKFPNLNDEYVIKEVEELYVLITSIKIENNRSEIIKLESPMDSKYKFTQIAFRKFMLGEITLDKFHDNIIELMLSIIKDDLNKPRYKYLVV